MIRALFLIVALATVTVNAQSGRRLDVIDPNVALLSFWNGDQPLAVLSYYACHPQSYYRTGIPSSDFPGIARSRPRQATSASAERESRPASGSSRHRSAASI